MPSYNMSCKECMDIKMAFWPALLANVGICALLLGYIFIGSFLFLSIENARELEKSTQTLLPTQSSSSTHKLNKTHTNIVEHTANAVMFDSVLLTASPEKTQSIPRLLDINDGYANFDAETEEERHRTVENIWEITVSLNILYKENWTRLAALELVRFQNQLIKRIALIESMTKQKDSINSPALTTIGNKLTIHHGQQFEWTFSTAFLYSLTLVSTVGYGTLTPHTALGRITTIIYATLGIPLMLIYLSSIGSVLGKLTRVWCLRTFCCCFCQGAQRNSCIYGNKPKKNEMNKKQQPAQHFPYCYVGGASTNAASEAHMLHSSLDTVSLAAAHSRTQTSALSWSLAVPIIFSLLLWLSYIAIGSIVISLLEQWPLVDSIYFCFMSLTTIGFCDLLPGTGWKFNNYSTLTYSAYSSNVAIWFCAVYILIGLTLISMCINMLHEEIMWRMNALIKLKKVSIKGNAKEQVAYYGGVH